MRFFSVVPAILLSATLALAAPQDEPAAALERRQATITSAPLFATGSSAGSGGTSSVGGPAVNPGNYTMPTSLTAVPTNPPTSSGGAAGASTSGGSTSSAGSRVDVVGSAAMIGVGAAVVAFVWV